MESDLLEDHLCQILYSQTCVFKTSDLSVKELVQEELRFIYKSKQKYNIHTNTQDFGNYGAKRRDHQTTKNQLPRSISLIGQYLEVSPQQRSCSLQDMEVFREGLGSGCRS